MECPAFQRFNVSTFHVLYATGRRTQPANFPLMKWWVPGALVMIIAGCGRAVPLVEYRDPEHGFAVLHPAGWTVSRSSDVWEAAPVAGGAGESAEFVLVATRTSDGRLDDTTIRQAVFTLLPVHGVSGFQQDGRTAGDMLWYKFEVTGASAGREWASVGAVAAGPARYHVVVCAKPLTRWRNEQKQCDEVVRSFQPGDLNR
jgi:hypothetical protein